MSLPAFLSLFCPLLSCQSFMEVVAVSFVHWNLFILLVHSMDWLFAFCQAHVHGVEDLCGRCTCQYVSGASFSGPVIIRSVRRSVSDLVRLELPYVVFICVMVVSKFYDIVNKDVSSMICLRGIEGSLHLVFDIEFTHGSYVG